VKRYLLIILVLVAAVGGASAGGGRDVVLIWFKDQPAQAIAAQVRAEHEAAIENLAAPLREIYAAHQGERAWLGWGERLVADDLSRELRRARIAIRREVADRALTATQPAFDSVARTVERAGGRILYRYVVRGGMAADLPRDAVPTVRRHPLVAEVERARFLRPCIDISMPTIGADAFWNAGYTGGDVRVAVIDTGVDSSHPGLVGHTWIEAIFHDTAQQYYDYGDDPTTTDDLQGHGTKCAGVVYCDYDPYFGALKQSTYAVNAKAGFRIASNGGGGMFDSDMYAAVEWAVFTAGVDAISFSFGATTQVDYDTMAAFWDAVVSSLSVPVSTAVGNGGPGGWPMSPSIGYNVMSVGGTTDFGTVDRSDDVIWEKSTTGPTRGGRKKPDVVVPCDSIKTTKNTWEDGPGQWWANSAATSWAAPHIAGAAGLLAQAGVTDPLAQKAILINTSEDKLDPGWNEDWGWGYTYLPDALAHLNDCFLGTVTAKGTPGAGRFYVGSVQDGDRITLTWSKRNTWRSGVPPSPSQIHDLTDLDLYTYTQAANSPLDSSTSDIDNVEQVNPSTANSVVAAVWCDSEGLDGVSEEPFALATPSGFAAAAAGFDVTGADLDPEIGNVFDLSSTVTNAGDLILHIARVTLSLPAGLTLLSGDGTQALGTLAPQESNVAHWRIRVDADGLLIGSIRAESDSYGGTIVGLGDLVVSAVRSATAPAGWINPGWNWISVPLLPDDPEAGAIFGVENVRNKLYRWDPVRKTFYLYPDDFTTLELGRGYILRSDTDQMPSFTGAPAAGTYEIGVPAAGWLLMGHPMNHATLLSLVSVRNNTLGQTRTAAEDRGAADPWVNWNWIYWDSARDTAKLLSLSGGDDDALRPWYGYLLWSNTENLTLLIPDS
jgi:hypothetical protein